MFCPKCGCRNDDNSKFCLSCGNPLAMFVQPEPYVNNTTPVGYTTETPAFYPTPDAYSHAPAVKPKKSGNGIAAAISSIITLLMFFLPWISVWGFSVNYFDMMDASGLLGEFVDEADTISAILIICMIAFSTLAIITIIKGFMGKTSGCGIAAGIIGICMVLALAIGMEFELGYMGMGAFLFLVSSVVILVLSCKK